MIKITNDEIQNRIKKAVGQGFSAEDAQKLLQQEIRAGKVQLESEAPVSEALAKKGVLGKIAGSIVAPGERGLRFLGGTLAAVPLSIANPKLAQSGDLPLLSSRQEKILRNQGQDVRGIAKEGLRSGAGIASYAIPGATGGKAVITGATRGALSAASDPFSTGTDIVAGGILGGATEGILSNVGSTFRKLTGKGKQLQSAGLKAEKASGSGLGSYSKEQSIIKSAEELGLKGTPAQKRVQVETLKTDYYKQLDDVLSKSKSNRSAKGITDELKRLVMDGDFYGNSAKEQEFLRAELSKLTKKAASGRLTARDVSQFKQGLSVDRAFDQLEKTGTIANQKDAIKYDLWRAVDEVLTKMAPEAKKITKQLSKLHDLAPGLKAAEFSGPVATVPFTNAPLVSGNTGYGIQDLAGRTLQGLGKLSVPAAATKSLTIGGTSGLPDQFDPQMTQESSQGEDLMGAQIDGQQTQPQSKFPLEQAQKAIEYDLQATGGKNYQKIIELYAFYNPQQDQTVSATNKIKIGQAQAGVSALDEVEKMIKDDPALLTKRLVPGSLLTRNYESAAFQAIDNLLRIQTGATAPDSEVRRYVDSYMPRFGDSSKVAQEKINRLRNAYQTIAGSL